MTPDPFRITIHMVTSLDGMIAKRDNSVSWFETPDFYEKGAPEEEPVKPIDCFVMGARTYEHAVELSTQYGWPYGDTRTIVLTHRDLAAHRPNIEFFAGTLDKLVTELVKPSCSTVWVVGGAVLAKDFIRAGLADEINLSILPIILGDGVPFFKDLGMEQALHLRELTGFRSGRVEMRYDIRK